MKPNVGSFDAAARTVVGAIIILIGHHHYHSWWALVGLIPIVSAMIAFCPLYRLCNFDTCAQDEGPADHPHHGTHSSV